MDNNSNIIASVVEALSSGRINTLTELRRMERTLLTAMQPRIDQLRQSPAMELLALSWTNYVNSNNLLSELRNLTRDYPFSSEMLDEAKTLVNEGQDRDRSWNFAWLVLTKIEDEELVKKHAKALAKAPNMWGGNIPPEEMVVMLEEKFRADWTRAVRIMLRHWEINPLYPAL